MEDKINVTDTFAPYDHLTKKTSPLETISQIQRRAEDLEPFGATTRYASAWPARAHNGRWIHEKGGYPAYT